jgi:hypothetical protein
MRIVRDKELDQLLDGLTVGGIYRLAWTLFNAWLGYVMALAAFGIIVSVIAGVLIGIFL